MVERVSHDIRSRQKFVVTSAINIPVHRMKVWELITAPGHLELFHPFCKEHQKVDHYELGTVDKATFNNGVSKSREVIAWEGGHGYKLWLKAEDNMDSYSRFQIDTQTDKQSRVTIEIETHAYRKIPRPIWPVFARWVLLPSFYGYQEALLSGLSHYLETGIKVQRNQFGRHKKFSP